MNRAVKVRELIEPGNASWRHARCLGKALRHSMKVACCIYIALPWQCGHFRFDWDDDNVAI